MLISIIIILYLSITEITCPFPVLSYRCCHRRGQKSLPFPWFYLRRFWEGNLEIERILHHSFLPLLHSTRPSYLYSWSRVRYRIHLWRYYLGKPSMRNISPSLFCILNNWLKIHTFIINILFYTQYARVYSDCYKCIIVTYLTYRERGLLGYYALGWA